MVRRREAGNFHPLGIVLGAGMGAAAAPGARFFFAGLHPQQSVCGVVFERAADRRVADAKISCRALRQGFRLLQFRADF